MRTSTEEALRAEAREFAKTLKDAPKPSTPPDVMNEEELKAVSSKVIDDLEMLELSPRKEDTPTDEDLRQARIFAAGLPNL